MVAFCLNLWLKLYIKVTITAEKKTLMHKESKRSICRTAHFGIIYMMSPSISYCEIIVVLKPQLSIKIADDSLNSDLMKMMERTGIQPDPRSGPLYRTSLQTKVHISVEIRGHQGGAMMVKYDRLTGRAGFKLLPQGTGQIWRTQFPLEGSIKYLKSSSK